MQEAVSLVAFQRAALTGAAFCARNQHQLEAHRVVSR